MGMILNYDLDAAGWADVVVQDAEATIRLRASYLHDSLRDLAQAAIALRDGCAAEPVVFMDEPGEAHLLIAARDDGILEYELRWFDDWKSSGRESESRLLHRGEVPSWEFLALIRRTLKTLLRQHGEDGYLLNWIAHPFPLRLYEELGR